MRRKLCEALVLVAGLVILLSAYPHATAGWPSLRPALVDAGVDGDVVAALGIGWYFGSVAMAALGLTAILVFVELRRGHARARRFAVVVAAAYLAFGLTAWLTRDLNPHFLIFVVPGALLLLGALIWRCEPA